MTLNALTRLEAAASEISPEGWRALMRAAERVALDMNALDVAMTLNALAKMPAPAGEVSTAGWEVLARATHDAASEMNGKGVAVTLNAYARLPWAAWDSLKSLPGGRGRLEDAAKREALHMTAQGRDMTTASCDTLSLKIPVALLSRNNENEFAKNDEKIKLADGDDDVNDVDGDYDETPRMEFRV